MAVQNRVVKRKRATSRQTKARILAGFMVGVMVLALLASLFIRSY